MNRQDKSRTRPPWSNFNNLLGYAAISRSHESLYAFISRMIVANHLNEREAQAIMPDELTKAAFLADRAYQSDAVSWLTERGLSQAHAMSKIDPKTWEVLPGFNSVPPTKLRICEQCFKSQSHSWAWSSDIVSQCPLHKCQLQETCPKCGIGLLRKGRTLRKSAFTCPRSCVLSAGALSGLGSPLNELGADHLEEQKNWIEKVRQVVKIEFGPTHIAYPTYLEVSSYRSAPTISRGLTMAILMQVKHDGAEVPAPLSWHDVALSTWNVSIRPWSPSLRCMPEISLEEARYSIHRDAYTTTLPVLDQAHAIEHFSLNPHLRDILKYENITTPSGTFSLIKFPADLMIANELNALYQSLSHDVPPTLAISHYQETMLDLLDIAVTRKSAIERDDAESPQLAVAERVDAILNVHGQSMRLVATSTSKLGSGRRWFNYQEPAELGYVYI